MASLMAKGVLTMKLKCSEFAITRASCAYFFIGPGLTYGLLTSRMPALKLQTGADETEIGLSLLCLGIAAMITLFASPFLIARWSSKTMLRIGSALLLLALPLCGLASTPFQLAMTCGVFGLSTGLTDICMNAQGIQIERKYRASSMSLLHASYSIGCVLASLLGSLFAAFGINPLLNFLCIIILYACLRPFFLPHLLNDPPVEQSSSKKSLRVPPIFIIICGLLAMCSYAVEGAAAEWGSLLLFTVKGASEQTAALVLGVFASATAICRLGGDYLRTRLGDFTISFGGSLLAACGMGIVLISPWPVLCLAGYACVGAGISIIVPILFSRAGKYPGVTPGEASATISVLAYSGLLFFPPTLGAVAHRAGLEKSLLIVFVLCWILCSGSFLLKTKKSSASAGSRAQA